PAVALRHRATIRGRRSAADDDGDRRLHGARHRLNALERQIRTAMDWLLLRPQRAHRREIVVADATAFLERRARRLHLRLTPADAEPEDHPTVREHVERRELLREHDGLALRKDD